MRGGGRVPFDCDVAIAGAGPAGSSAAIWCARHRPGESLHPGVEPLFEQLGVAAAVRAAGFHRYRGHWVSWAAPPRFDEFGSGAEGPWLGFQAWRADLDAILLREAVSAGATLLQPCRVSAPILENRRIAGVRYQSGEVHARFTIDATGGHWLQRRAGIAVRRVSRLPRRNLAGNRRGSGAGRKPRGLDLDGPVTAGALCVDPPGFRPARPETSRRSGPPGGGGTGAVRGRHLAHSGGMRRRRLFCRGRRGFRNGPRRFPRCAEGAHVRHSGGGPHRAYLARHVDGIGRRRGLSRLGAAMV